MVGTNAKDGRDGESPARKVRPCSVNARVALDESVQLREGCDATADSSIVFVQADVDAFFMDAKPVTNSQFRDFVRATHYKTESALHPRRCMYGHTSPQPPLSQRREVRLELCIPPFSHGRSQERDQGEGQGHGVVAARRASLLAHALWPWLRH